MFLRFQTVRHRSPAISIPYPEAIAFDCRANPCMRCGVLPNTRERDLSLRYAAALFIPCRIKEMDSFSACCGAAI